MKLHMLIKLIIIFAGLVLFAWCFFPCLGTGNFHIGGITGAGLGAALALYGIFMDQVNDFLCSFWKAAFGKIVIILVSLIAAAILSLACACIISMVSSSSRIVDPEADPDSGATVLVLGCKVYSYGPSRSLTSRLGSALEYLKAHPDSSVIVCGGQGKNEPCSEASAMGSYLLENGIAKERIFLEDESIDTHENLANACGIINNNGLNPQTVIVTSDYHIYRALKIAEDAGLTSPSAVSASTLWWLFPSLSIREMYGILEMWFLY